MTVVNACHGEQRTSTSGSSRFHAAYARFAALSQSARSPHGTR